MTGQDTDRRRIEHAVAVWSRSVFSAPRRLHALVMNIESRDEVIVRVATTIVRRELREVCAPTRETRSTRPRIDPTTVDPFAHDKQTLCAESEHVIQCRACSASGWMRCERCVGSGLGPCPGCHGSGTERSAKTGRPIKCKACKASRTAACSPCGGRGSIPCDTCRGSGHQLAWLTLEETRRCEVMIPIKTPVVLAHPALREPRAITASDVAALSVLDDRSMDGPLDVHTLPGADREVVHAQLEQLDRRLERVTHQQYLKLAVVRRDVTFEMCGKSATLSLSGSSLAGATTPEVLRPIRRRLYAWAALCVLVAVGGRILRDALVGSSSYFTETRATANGLTVAATICAIPMFGAVLRSWRGGLRFHPIRWPTKAWATGLGVALASIVVVGLRSPPAAAEVTQALAAGDLARARAVVEAIHERIGATREAVDLDDQVLLAEASKRQGRDRLALLDIVVAHQGGAAPAAAADASTQRLEEVRALIASRHPVEALAALDRLFGNNKAMLVAEERARAHEAAQAACPTPACALAEAIQASSARPTPARTTAVEQARTQLWQALDLKLADGANLVSRLQRVRQLADLGMATRTVALDDEALQERGRAATAYADGQARAVPLLGSPLPVAEQLLGPSTKSSTGATTFVLDGVTVYLASDKAGRCTGVYATGGSAASRSLASATWPAGRLLSQALGKPSVITAPSAGQSQSRWFVGRVSVVGRWDAGALVELRIGDAIP